MYIKKIVINNIRCFKNIEIDLSSPQGSKMWTLLLGDNGVGKTAVLRCLAMGLVDATSASALLRELYGEWIRQQAEKSEKSTIRIEFHESQNNRSYFIETEFKQMASGDSEVSQKTFPENFPWNDIFVCGYGAARRAYGTKDYSEYSTIDAVYTLFNYDSPLQNPELILRRIEDTGIKRDEILAWIDKILMLPQGCTKIETGGGISLHGPWGKSVTLGALGDGHQATLAWLTDMLGWAMFYDNALFKQVRNELSGIVLLDEIEQHLHPSWQKQIIKLLSDQFPNLQFVATTHSPLCVIGSVNLTEDNCSLVLLTQNDDHVIAKDKLPPPRGRRADQVLTSYLFGLDTTSDDETTNEVQRYSYLASRKRTPSEEAEYKRLFGILNNKLGSKETELEQVVSNAISETLEKDSKGKEYDKTSLTFEIKRQLKNLLEGL